MEERLHRILQRPGPRRMPEHQPVLVDHPSPGDHQRLEGRIQQPPKAFKPGLPHPGQLRCSLHPPLADSHPGWINTWGPVNRLGLFDAVRRQAVEAVNSGFGALAVMDHFRQLAGLGTSDIPAGSLMRPQRSPSRNCARPRPNDQSARSLATTYTMRSVGAITTSVSIRSAGGRRSSCTRRSGQAGRSPK